MKGIITKGKLVLVGAAMALAIAALAACGTDATATAAPSPAKQQTASTDAASLLRTQSGSEALAQLLRGSITPSSDRVSGIWVSGQGEASAAPDIATLSLGVEAFAKTVAEARGDGALAMSQVIDVLKANGIADRDIQTRFFNINARYTTVEVTKCVDGSGFETAKPDQESLPRGIPLPPGDDCVVERQRVIQGYDVTNQLSVKVRALDSVGEIIDQVTAAGGDLIRFQGVRFSIEDTEALQIEARKAAAGDLLAKARQVASLTGVELGKLVYITESGGPIITQFARAESAAFAAPSAPTPIQSGELSISVSLQAAFEIGQE